jgi:two-component system, cell cycle sensor histidine kinase and response regulator CckA
VALFVAEVLVLFAASRVLTQGVWTGGLLVATTYSILVFPAVYFFVLPAARRYRSRRCHETPAPSEPGLLQTAAQCQGMLDLVPHGIHQSTPGGRLITVNTALARILGYDSIDEVLHPLAEAATLLHPAGLGSRAEFLRAVTSDPEPVSREFEILRQDGSRRWVSEHIQAVRDARGAITHYLGTVTDITERVEAQQRLRDRERSLEEDRFLRTQRLESIGLLAGGIAHDLNNVLTPIMMAVDLIKLTAADDNQSLLDTIRASTQRGSEMARGVLSFARGLDGRREGIHMRRLVREMAAIARETFPKNITVRATASPDVSMVAGDPTQLLQVLLNLCINSRDAMPAGGLISITARNVAFDAQDPARPIDAATGPFVLIQVSDTGTGIPQSIIDKVFDPFFTTKEVGKGTGLGLSTSLTIVRNHGGFVRVSSPPESGAVFDVYLPALTAGGDASLGSGTAELPRGDGETVLIVDDEAAVREMTRQTLEAFGYRILLAAHGVEALAVYESHRADISVVVTDMLMPVMDGAATIRALLNINPAVRIIAMSGSNDAVSQTLPESESGPIQVLPKPYTPETLLLALRQTLERRCDNGSCD